MRVTDQCDRLGKVLPKIRTEAYNDKARLLNYMKSRKFVSEASTARVFDYISGSKDNNYCCIRYTDGKYEWTSYDIMYVEKYNMKLNDDFIQHILNRPE